MKLKTALTIAGSDSSGGAGIQADIKTMTMNGVYAMSAITALTAQNTTGVRAIRESTPEFLAQQIDAVFEDIRPDAVKIGMVASSELIRVIADRLHPLQRHCVQSRQGLAPARVRPAGQGLHLRRPVRHAGPGSRQRPHGPRVYFGSKICLNGNKKLTGAKPVSFLLFLRIPGIVRDRHRFSALFCSAYTDGYARGAGPSFFRTARTHRPRHGPERLAADRRRLPAAPSRSRQAPDC